MAANSYDFGVNLKINADTKLATQQLGQLQQQLGAISNMKINFNGLNSLTSEINKASSAAMVLQQNLQAALNPQTGNLNFSKFNAAITGAGYNIDTLGQSLLAIGPQGSQAFTSLANSIAKSEVPLMRTNNLVNGLWTNLKKTAGWQLSSSMIHGFIGGVQQAVGYAKALDQSLTNIRIVTGQSAEQMAQFAKEANAAARRLSTTTTDYTNASLIYYQQGLSDAEVKKRADVTLKMANVSGQTAAKVADQMTSIWNNFDNGTKSMEHYADVMTALGAATASSSQEIAKGIQKFAAISDTVGLSYEYAASALATITATTRESADTVGNSLKTLFSRIQGLQLGDTLDDGTTLNKYSSALAKVGISIKDASGALKDMDTILDDMGAKWHTLAEDQKMALAQTVGGVRQYTQIMTLMENWDFFKSNLNIAEGSAGTLQKQAEIFEDSWQGAQKRMKASWENLWDTLIDSDGFKKILNIGSTIVDSMTKAFAGLGGMGGIFSGGILGFSTSLLGNVFKSQLSNSVDNVFYNLGQLNPNAKAAAEAKRTATVTSMANSIRDPYLNPSMGEMQRNVSADNVINIAQERMAYARVSQYLRPEEQAMYASLNARAEDLSKQQADAAGRIDHGRALIERGRLANENDTGFYTNSTSWTRDPSTDKKGGGMRASNFVAALFQEGVNADGTSTQSISSVLTNFGQRSVTAQEQFGNFQTWLTDGKKPGQDGAVFDYNKLLTKDSQGRYTGEAFDTFANLYGLNNDERGLINSKSVAQLRESGNYRLADIKRNIDADMDAIFKSIAENEQQTDPAIKARAVTAAMEQRRANAEDTLVKGLTQGQGAKKGVNPNAVRDILKGSKEAAEGQRVYDSAGKERKGVEEDRDRIANKQITPGRAVVSGALGLSSTSTAISSAEGAINSLMSGNFLGFASGVGSAAMNMRMGAQNYAEMFQGFQGLGNKFSQSGEKAKLLQEQSDLRSYARDISDARKQLKQVNTSLKATDLTEEQRENFLAQKKVLEDDLSKFKVGDKAQRLREVNKALEDMKGVKASTALGKVGKGLEYVSERAQQFSGALQVAQITMKIVNSALDYMYNENQRKATTASKASAELSQAYTLNQKNHSQLLANISEYEKATSKLGDMALEGTAYSEAVYQQNKIANELIGKYNLQEEDYTRVGDKIVIKDEALKAAEEKSIKNMAVSKYAADIQKVNAREANNKYQEETLERSLTNEGTTKAGIGIAAAIGAGALALMLPIAAPLAVAAAIAIGSGVGIGAGALSEHLYDVAGNNSAVDKAKELTRKTGSTAWMDEEGAAKAVGLSESKFEELKENRHDLENLVNNEDATARQKRAVFENTARDILNTNEETEDFKYKDHLTEGVADIYAQESEITKDDQYHQWWRSKETKKQEAKLLEDELGLSGKDNLTWTDDFKGKRLTYSYMENGQQITGQLSYEAMAQMKANARAKDASDKYVKQQMEFYEQMKSTQGEAAAAGMLSLMSGKNFDTATLGEMREATNYLKELGLTQSGENFGFYNSSGLTDWGKLGNFAKSLGLDIIDNDAGSISSALNEYASNRGFEGYQEMLNLWGSNQNYTSSVESLMQEFAGKKDEAGNIIDKSGTYQTWFEGQGKNLYESMNMSTMQDFYTKLNHITDTQGTQAGQLYLDSLTGMLEGADPDKVGSIMSSLMALDWSDWNIDDSIVDVMDSFGISIDNTNEDLTNFVDLVRSAANALPNLETEMNSLIQVAGSLENVKIGDTLSDDVVQALKDQNINIDDYVFSTWDGKNIVTQDIEGIRERVQEEIGKTYGTYAGIVDKVDNSVLLQGLSESEREEKLRKIKNLSQSQFESMVQYSDENYDNNMGIFVRQVLTDKEREALNTNIDRKEALMQDIAGYKVEDGVLKKLRDDGSYTAVGEGELTLDEYNKKVAEIDSLNQSIAFTFEKVTSAVDATLDPEAMKTMSEQYVSTFGSYQEAMMDTTTQSMIDKGYLTEQDALNAYALSKYPQLTEYVQAYNEAMKGTDKDLQQATKEQLEYNIALQDGLAAYSEATGQKATLSDITATITAIKNDMDEETAKRYKDSAGEWNETELLRLAEETMIAGVGRSTLEKYGVSDFEAMKKLIDPADATAEELKAGGEAAIRQGKALWQYLGLTEYQITGLTTDTSEKNPIVQAIKDLNISITKILEKDVAETSRLRAYLVSQSTAGKGLQDKLKITGWGTDDFNIAGTDSKAQAFKTMMGAYNSETGVLDEETFAEGNSQMLDAFNKGEITWEQYSAGVEMASGGTRRALEKGTSVKITPTKKWQPNANNPDVGRWVDDPNGGQVTVYDVEKIGNQMIATDRATGVSETYDSTKHGTAYATDGSEIDADNTPTGGSPGGRGGGGPTKVAVKSAQDMMTRYKTIDAKAAIAEMQKAAALNQKDLLYGEAKIAQLQKINGLLVKQQRLTADRIEEERQYLAEDKKHLEEVLKRYNKDKLDKDGNLKEGEELLELEFNSEGIITNYKQTIGAWAEELAAFYRDGELTSEEGKKAEELQKKIEDLNVVIGDYEDSLNQLQTSIDTYEQTLYEMFANQAEELAYKVTYTLELENDDLTYIKFYATALKDSMGRISDYIELTGNQANELYNQLAVYDQGIKDLMDNAANNPMYMWITEGKEGIYSAEDIANLRTYRDGLNTTYTSLTALRKEVEDKVLKVFNEWNEKVEKNINSISRYTDMLSSFKDIINIIGKDNLKLSDSFMKAFEQQSIDQSRDNIEAAKKQYESLSQMYADAQAKLEQARMIGNEETINHWEEVVDKTQEEMESAQDSMLTTLNHTLNLIAEQFTNAMTEAIDTFNETVYEFGGLEGLISDYEAIREQRDLMVEDYEKIYNLNKLNRQIEKTLDDTKIIAGKQKLIEFQEKINDLSRNNVELSKFELEYLQAEYELRLAEIELENSRNSKDTVRLSRDSEGNWSYIYTQNESAIAEAEQKYEDALYKMQQTSQEYQNEMSSSMMEMSQKMVEEISALSLQELGAEKYQEEMDRIKQKYADQMAFYESELNKSISTSKNLYDEDWKNYSEATGYKLSTAEHWADSFSETTLGGLMGSGAYMSDYTSTVMGAADEMTDSISRAATTYFNESNKALETYGTSIDGFATHLQSTTAQITASSKQATADVNTMANDMVDAFSKVADEVKNWQDTFGQEISELLDEIGNKIQEINNIIKQSNEMGKSMYSSTDLIGQAEAIELINKETFNNKDLFGSWTFDEKNGVARGTYTDANGEVKEDVERNIVEFTGQLVEMIDELTGKYYESKTGSSEREMYGEQLKKLFADYWKFKNIVNRIYDLTDITIPEPKLDKDKVEGLATGGYTGEWGDSGKLAFLHEKELVLNANDTANFLEALQVSRQLVEMIEMNARQSSLGLGEMYAAGIQDTTQTIEQQVSITAEFPNATDHSEIEQAFDNLINMASQYAYRN